MKQYVKNKAYYWSSKRPESAKNWSVWFKSTLLSLRVCLSRSDDCKKLKNPKSEAQLRFVFNFFKIRSAELNNTSLWDWNLWHFMKKWAVLSGHPQWEHCCDNTSYLYCECWANLDELSLKDLRSLIIGMLWKNWKK